MILMNKATIALAFGIAMAGITPPVWGTSYKLLFSLSGTDGFEPNAAPIKIGNLLYATATAGGKNDTDGTVFAINRKTGAGKFVYQFQNSPDGASPSGAMIKVGDLLYGVSSNGGTGFDGTVFSLNTKTGVERVVYSFQGGSDGGYPTSSLTNLAGTLYGTTYQGGGSTNCMSGCGTVFSVNASTGVEKVLYTFQGANDGATPDTNLIKVGGGLFGTTYAGGGSTSCNGGCGTVFEIDLASGIEKTVYAFKGGKDGRGPLAGLISVGRLLYGTTIGDGAYSSGTVFSVNSNTGKEKIVYAFQGGNDGAAPFAGLIEIAGTLYGTTADGGSGSSGTVFSLNPMTGAETVLYSFQGNTDGGSPGGVVNVNETLYGTTAYGGNGYGTVFELTP